MKKLHAFLHAAFFVVCKTNCFFYFCLYYANIRLFLCLSDNFHFPADDVYANQIKRNYKNYLI